MNENGKRILWLYRNKYYDTIDDAVAALFLTNPGANLGSLLDIAEKEIIEVYEADIVTDEGEKNAI